MAGVTTLSSGRNFLLHLFFGKQILQKVINHQAFGKGGFQDLVVGLLKITAKEERLLYSGPFLIDYRGIISRGRGTGLKNNNQNLFTSSLKGKTINKDILSFIVVES